MDCVALALDTSGMIKFRTLIARLVQAASLRTPQQERLRRYTVELADEATLARVIARIESRRLSI